VSLSLVFFGAISGAALLCYALLLAITLRKGLRGPAERYFAGYLGSMMLWSLGAMMMYMNRDAAPQWNRVMIMGVAAMPFTFYGFVQGFRGRDSGGLAIRLGAAIMGVMLVLVALGYLAKDVSVTDEGLIEFEFGPAVPAFAAYYLGYLGLAGSGLLSDLRTTQDFEARNRTKYILVGLGAVLLGNVTNIIPHAAAMPLDIAANLVNALIISYAISRYHLLDLTVIVRKGLMYSLSTALVVAGYLVIVFLGVDLLHLVGGTRFLLALAVAIAVAAVLQPGRDWVQGWVDRFFFRGKYDAGPMLQRLSRQVARLLDLEQLARLILDEVCNAMQVSAAALLIRDGKNGDYITLGHVEQARGERQASTLADLRLRPDNPVAVWLAGHDEVLTARDLGLKPQFKGLWIEERTALEAAAIGTLIGLTVGHELVGILALGPKRSESPYTPDELRTLQTLANQVAVAVQNAWLYGAAVEEKERAQTILQAASAGIVVADRGSRIVAMNPSAEAITGHRLAELQGRPLVELLGLDLVGDGQPLAAALDAASSLPPTEVSLNGGGRPRDVLMKMTPLRDGFLVNFVDITRLKEVDRLKSEIVANVSHELRGPLASIKGYTELMLEGMDGEDLALRQRFLSVINEETDRLAGFINDLLDLSRLESGQVELVLAPAPVDALVAEVARSLELQARAAGVAIQVAVPAGLPPVTVDRGLMLGALRNLVSNAIKFSPRGAAVEVAGRADCETVVLEVADHGPGIPAEDLPNLFTKFHRGRAARQAGIVGTGLGLVLAKQAIERHLGALTVDTAPGRGSRFIVTLPVGEAAIPDERPE
jgi:PAS domain S-box-containing protein